jgi:hypothetical protein
MSTYSTRFLSARLNAGSDYHASVPVPTGFIWVIRNITAQQTGNFGGFVNIWAPESPVSPLTGQLLLSQELYHVFGQFNNEYRQVLNAGELLAAQGASAISPIDIIISGYQLSVP